MRTWFLATAVFMLAFAGPGSAQTVELEPLLARVAVYAGGFFDKFPNVVAEERYQQEASAGSVSLGQLGRGSVSAGSVPRSQKITLQSEFLLVRVPGGIPIAFRDVVAVNGVAIRDREDRLQKLLNSGSRTALEQAQQITKESARYNIGNMTRTINSPLIALAFLIPEVQPRFAFTLGKNDPAVGPSAWIIEYRERQRPSLIRGYGDSDLLATGRAWVDIESGAVLRTEFTLDDAAVNAKLTTSFKRDERLGLNVPQEMAEEYKLSGGSRVTGKATYSRFRQFEVKTDEEMKPKE
jgi:hypothetical protein